MQSSIFKALIRAGFWLAWAITVPAQAHPNLLLTEEGVEKISAELRDYPMFYQAFQSTQAKVDAALSQPTAVPLPEHGGGGYTHEQHKKNYNLMYEAGILYQVSKEAKYANFVRDMLFEYADMYPTLGPHPVTRSSSRGRLFWQTLNEAVWLLYTIQAYDAIVEALTEEDKDRIETNLFLPIATFLSDGQPKTFDRIHNHGTWAAAAVGMTGYVLGNEDFVQKALYGLDKSGNSGFLKQMELLFSPDGYYNEGPYYHRYALMPFVVFAQAIENNQPELKIFDYRDGILLKAIYGLVQLSYNKLFFPLNDAIKDKGIKTVELQYGIAIAYGITGDASLLSVARDQGNVVLTGEGLALARGLAKQVDKPFPYRSMQFRDGAKGDRGALAILRSSNEPGHQALVVKNTAQGLGHGHFDKLSWLYYDNGSEVVQDYGAARFLNIEPKNGGHYLRENKSWAKQTIAHNTVVVDETSHFDMNLQLAESRSPEVMLFDVAENVELVSARMDGAYPDTSFLRTMAMLKDPKLEHPLVLDILQVSAGSLHQYDLPVHYKGHIVNIDFDYRAKTKELKPLGKGNGYQHLWLKAQADVGSRAGASNDTSKSEDRDNLSKVTWLLGDRFYTLSILTEKPQQILFTELGANDPDFNLTKASAVIQRIKAVEHTFVSALESHGEYNGTLEFTREPYSSIAQMELVEEGVLDFLRIKTTHGDEWGLAISYNQDKNAVHEIQSQGSRFKWKGFYKLFKI